MSNYTNIHGVEITKWFKDGDVEEWDDRDAMVEEMYYEGAKGRIVLTVVTDDGLISQHIPVQAVPEWNEFVESLPKWSSVD
jgi:hypothetical protein